MTQALNSIFIDRDEATSLGFIVIAAMIARLVQAVPKKNVLLFNFPPFSELIFQFVRIALVII